MSFESVLMEKRPRKTPISWEDLIGNILDQYRQYVDDISHAVQKDAIQNSWDARTDANRWRMHFKFLRDSNGREMFIMRDYGTTGLTGRILPEEEYDKDLPEEERWGRFQGLAFRRENPKALGARGQGKFVFVGASQTGTIVYDTLREDGVYRLGVRRLGDLWEREGRDAIRLLKSYSPDLEPLHEIGTRIIIDSPVQELKHAVRTGMFVKYIQTTWWPILISYGANITVEAGSRRWKVVVPRDLKFPSSDSKDYKVWIREGVIIRGTSKRGLRVKKLYICWSRNPIREDIRGIAVLRGGMVVERIPVTELLSNAEPELSQHIYGFVEGDMGVQYLLKKIEDPTHYRFRRRGGWGRKNIFGVMKEYVAGQIQLFAREKLGLEKETTKTARDVETIKTFNKLLKVVGVSIFSPSPPPTDVNRGTRAVKDLDLMFPAPNFPNPLRRVEYGQEISNIHLKITNRTSVPATVRLRVYTEQELLVRDVILEKTYKSIPPGFTAVDGPLRVKIDKRRYSRGRCHLRARLICLDHPDYEKGRELDKAAHIFWIAEDPPPRGRGPYRDMERLPEVIEQIDKRRVKVDGKVMPHPDGGYTLVINVGHPLYKRRGRTRDEESEYIIDLMARKLPQILIACDHEFFRDIDDPVEVMKRSWALYSEIMEKYYGQT